MSKKRGGKSSKTEVKPQSTAALAGVTPSLEAEEALKQSLRKRITELDVELDGLRIKIEQTKTENDWYRRETEETQRETADYLKYLEGRQDEKQNLLEGIDAGSTLDYDHFQEEKRQIQAQRLSQTTELNGRVKALELQLEQKRQEVVSLTDVMSKKNSTEAELDKLRKDMLDLEEQHESKVSQLERTLLEERVRFQKEADAQLLATEREAQEYAATFLKDYIRQISEENEKLKVDLKEAIQLTAEYTKMKQVLEAQNKQLERERQVRSDVIHVQQKRIERGQQRLQSFYHNRDDEYL